MQTLHFARHNTRPVVHNVAFRRQIVSVTECEAPYMGCAERLPLFSSTTSSGFGEATQEQHDVVAALVLQEVVLQQTLETVVDQLQVFS